MLWNSVFPEAGEGEIAITITNCLPTSFEIRDYDIMENFIEGLPEAVQGRMYSAIQGKGAFRRFKDMVIDMGIEQVWYDFRDDVYKRKAARWCDENGIEYE